MLYSVALPLIVLFASPDVSEPERAFQELVAHVRKQEFGAAWDALAPEAQKKLGRALRDKLGAKETEDMGEVIKAWAARMRAKPNNPLQMLADLKVTVEKVEQKGDSATLTAHTAVAGFPKSGLVVMVKHDGKWKLKDLKAPGASNPDVRSLRANELSAIATLRNVVSAQAQFQACGVVDCNQNGSGEYGTFAEMAAGAVLRGQKNKMNPPVLSLAFREPRNGRVTRSGYHYRIYLPDAKGGAVNEKDDSTRIDAKLAEVAWCAYAWPVKAGETGKHAFFINQMGDVLVVEAKGYSGDKEPSPYAAFAPDAEGKPVTAITGATVIGKKASDGRVWKPAG